MESIELKRFSKQILLPGFGLKSQQKLRQGRVLVVGAGGLGCAAMQYLAVSGVGYLGIVDFDKVEVSNLPRQILYTEQSIGKFKTEEARRKLLELNPGGRIDIWSERLNSTNVSNIFKDFDIIIDATDNIETRYIIDRCCNELDKPWVFGAVYRYEGQLSVLNYVENEKKGPTYNCIFPENEMPGTIPDCETAGVLGVLPGIIGTMQASECIKIITGFGQVMSGVLYQLNIQTLQSHTFVFERCVP